MATVRTNIVLDEALVKKAMKLLGARSKREAVDMALKRTVTLAELYAETLASRGKLKCSVSQETNDNGC